MLNGTVSQLVQIVDATNPTQGLAIKPDGSLVTSSSTSVSSSLNTNQKKIATTGTAVQLSSTSITLNNGIVVKAKKTNTASITVGTSSITNTADGTGNSFVLDPGDSISIPANNVNLVYINGTTGDWVSYLGN